MSRNKSSIAAALPEALLTATDRQQIYHRCGLSREQAREIEATVRGSPARKVGQGALQNLRGLLPSKKSGEVRLFESHTVERLWLYELELDPAVRGYYVQVPCAGVTHLTPSGRRHVSAATIDGLVFRDDSITLTECKDSDWLAKAQGRHGWTCSDGRWTREPYERWASERGIAFKVWTPPYPSAIYLRNMEAAYALLGEVLTDSQRRAADDTVAALSKRAYALGDLQDSIEGLTARIALWLIAHRQAYGLMLSFPCTDARGFTLFGSRADAEAADAAILTQRADALMQPVITSALQTASGADLAAARRRLERLEAINNKTQPATVRMTQLAKRVTQEVAAGTTPLEACLTKYSACGNRTPRLTNEQRRKLEEAAIAWRRAGAPLTKQDAWYQLEKSCKPDGIITPCLTTLKEVLGAQDPTQRALAIGGVRAYQAVSPRSDPRHRSGRALGFGHTLHIDSSKRDIVCTPAIQALIAERRNSQTKGDGRTYDCFYVGVDDATDYPVAHAFVCGPARIDAEAILIREFVYRHGMLPKVIIVDSGPENTSLWLKEFCAIHSITLIHVMTAGSRWNSEAEIVVNQLNKRVSHRLPGSTAPDQAGRKVDPSFKGRATARLDFLTICGLFEGFLYEDLPNIPKIDGMTPSQRKDEAQKQFGNMGTPHALDDEMLIATSPRWDNPYSVSEKRGIRIYGHDYTSKEVRALLRTCKPQELRLDPVDPGVLYVRINDQWFKAFHGEVQQMAALSQSEKLWCRLIEPVIQRDNRIQKTKAGRLIDQKLSRALQATTATGHLGPGAVAAKSETRKGCAHAKEEPKEEDTWGTAWDDTDPLPESDN